ncbi:MAG: GHKL domain-containing protein [Lachnospiraceae bacterium]|nr:GHKL domain-containing protein [Lachnospiraceae bacterium]
MEKIELYYKIATHTYSVMLTLIMSFCYAAWIRPFLARRRTVWLCGVTYAAAMEILINIPISMTNTVLYGLGVMSVFLVMCLLERENAGQKFFLAVTFFCLQWQSLLIESSVANELYLVFVKIGERLQGPLNYENLFWFRSYLVQSVFDLALAFLLIYGSGRLMLWAYGRKREDMKGRELLILLVPTVSGVFAYEVIRYYNKIYERDSGKYVLDIYGYHDWLMILYSVICFMTIFVMTYVYRQWKDEQEEDKQREVFSRQMHDLESHITEVERLYRNMRSLRHDMGNHLMVLEQLYDAGEYEEAGRYAGTLKGKVQEASLDAASGNPVTDIILSGKKKEMEEKEIAFICDFHYPRNGTVNVFDVSIILNNALTNAIEAVEREKMTGTDTGCIQHDMNVINAPCVSLSSHCMKNMYIIEVANTYAGELETDMSSGLPYTSKSGEGHGFGLTNIRQAARKYYGDIEIGKEMYGGQECCVLRVLMQIPEE